MNDLDYFIQVAGLLNETPEYVGNGSVKIKINNDIGMGSCGLTRDVGYKSIVYYMTPDEFLMLTPAGFIISDFQNNKEDKGKFLKEMQTTGIAMPFLTVSRNKYFDILKVDGHEGRHRCIMLKELGINEKIPVIIHGGDDPIPMDLNGFVLEAQNNKTYLTLNNEDKEVFDNYKFKNFKEDGSYYEFGKMLPDFIKELAYNEYEFEEFLQKAWQHNYYPDFDLEYELEDVLWKLDLPDEKQEQIKTYILSDEFKKLIN